MWINTVPKSLLDTLSKDEKKRQENIFELVYTEKDFVDDLKYMKEVCIASCRSNSQLYLFCIIVLDGPFIG